MIEREIKLVFPAVDAARAAVRAAGATPSGPRRLQDDALFDSSDGLLRQKGCIVRVRTERWMDGRTPDAITLTFKGPVQPGRMKIREEQETRVENGAALRRVLEALDLQPWFRYQKYREEFAAPELTVAIDETPVGTFIELEGGEEAIVTMTTLLGRTPGDFIRDSYYRLFQARREEYGLTGAHMIFPDQPAVPE